jgi:tetratricopeptide (TPR) repeat protein
VRALTLADPGSDRRQLGVVSAKGDSATYTGKGCTAWAGGRRGPGYAVQGNILAGEDVVAAMEKAFLEARGDLAERLYAALAAGDAKGGDSRGRQSAALLVVRAGGGYGGYDDRSIGEQSVDLLDRRMQCLDERLRDLEGLVLTLTRADTKTVENAARAVSRLRPIADCSDWRALAERVAPPDDPAARAAVDVARAELAKVRALEIAGHYQSGRSLAEAALASARKLGYRPLVAEALYRLGRVQSALGDNEAAAATLGQAAAIAVAVRHDAVASRAHIAMALPLGHSGRRDAALVVSDLALAHVAGAGGDPVLRAEALRARAEILGYSFTSGKDAEAAVREAVTLLSTAVGEEARFAEALMQLSSVTVNLGRHAEAIALAERVYGSLHPRTAAFTAQVGAALIIDHQHEKALAILRRALERQERALGATHLLTLSTRAHAARALVMLGRYREGRDELARVSGLAAPEWRHSVAFRAAVWHARALLKLGDVEAARVKAQRLGGMARSRFGPKNGLHGEALRLRAEVLEQAGDLAGALAEVRAATAVFRSVDDWSELAPSLEAEVRLLRKLGRTQEAIARGESALRQLEARLGFGVDAARTAVELAASKLAAGECSTWAASGALRLSSRSAGRTSRQTSSGTCGSCGTRSFVVASPHSCTTRKATNCSTPRRRIFRRHTPDSARGPQPSPGAAHQLQRFDPALRHKARRPDR